MLNASGHSTRNAGPLVTVVASCYNHARFLNECLDGILGQTYKNIELIIIDDCSKDNSAQLINSWIQRNGIKCTFLKNDGNMGICRTINKALARARGKYVSMTSTDDVWFPDKIEKQVSIMERQPDRVGVLYSDALIMDESGRLIRNSFIAAHRALLQMPEGNIHTTLWQGNFIPAMTTLIRRACFETVGYFDEELYFEDWDMWLRMALQYEFCYSKDVSARYRMVSSSMAHSNTDKMLSAGVQMCRKHIDNGLVTPQAMPHIADKLYFYAEQSYMRRVPELMETMGLALKYDRQFRTRCISLLAKMGIPYKYFAWMRGLIESRSFSLSKFGSWLKDIVVRKRDTRFSLA